MSQPIIRYGNILAAAFYMPLVILAGYSGQLALSIPREVLLSGAHYDSSAAVLFALTIAPSIGLTSYYYALLVPERLWLRHPWITGFFAILSIWPLLLAIFMLVSTLIRTPFSTITLFYLYLTPLLIHASYKCFRFIRLVTKRKNKPCLATLP